MSRRRKTERKNRRGQQADPGLRVPGKTTGEDLVVEDVTVLDPGAAPDTDRATTNPAGADAPPGTTAPDGAARAESSVGGPGDAGADAGAEPPGDAASPVMPVPPPPEPAPPPDPAVARVPPPPEPVAGDAPTGARSAGPPPGPPPAVPPPPAPGPPSGTGVPEPTPGSEPAEAPGPPDRTSVPEPTASRSPAVASEPAEAPGPPDRTSVPEPTASRSPAVASEPPSAGAGTVGEGGAAGEGGGAATERRPRRAGGPTGIGLALRTLVVPDHTSGFWDELSQSLTDEPQLRLRPRSAVRPITQPPPVADERLLDDEETLRRRSRRARRRSLAWLVVVAVAAIGAVGALQRTDAPSDEQAAGETTVPQATTTASTATPSTTVPAVERGAQLTPRGIGHLQVGTSLGDLRAAGIVVDVDEPTFESSGGACFDARAVGAEDLTLRFRGPVGSPGVSDPDDGVLASVSVGLGTGSLHATDTGIGLGATVDQVRAAYGGALTEMGHPFVQGGQILVHPVGDGGDNAVALHTDGTTVIGIAVGSAALVDNPAGCG